MLKPKVLLTATIGNAIEYYDITLYGFFAVFLSPLFFPADNLLTSQLASFGAFAAGFVVRPFGGLIFGHIGDRFGRKKALVTAILLVSLPTTIIGILPTYASIGIFAPIILVMCRILQGICTGGEYSGAAIFISEHHRKGREGLAGSILPASSIMGAILGTSLGGICILSNMPPWGWRIPFLIGGVFGIMGYFLRNTLVESPEFLIKKKENRLIKFPVLEVFKQDKKGFLCAIGISAYNIVLFYVPAIYIVQFMLPKEVLAATGMFLNTGLMTLLIILLPLMGFMSDRFGKVRLMTVSACTSFCLAIPLFLFLSYENSLLNVFIVLTIFGFLMSASVAPSVSFVPTLFPVQQRYSAMAIAIGLGEILGGMTPLVCHALVSWVKSPIAPAFYLMMFSLFGWVAIKYSQSNRKSMEGKMVHVRAVVKVPNRMRLRKVG